MRLGALVLAAGAGSRFGGDKLSAPFRGEPLIAHALRAACAAPVERVVVAAAPGLVIDSTDERVEVVRVPSDALSTSLKAGVAALAGCDGVFVFLGDMPLVPLDVAAPLAHLLAGGAYAAQPRHAGKPGHPVLLSARAMADTARLSGDEGAGRLLRASGDVAFLEVDGEGVLLDVDRVEDIVRLEGRQAP